MASFPDNNLRIVLLGKTGSGKSAAGNTILGSDEFTESSSSLSGTEQCEKQEAELEGQVISVIDTPGLFDTSMKPEELKSEIEKCIFMSAPGPHVFLLVIRLDVKFTDEEKNTVTWIQDNFGDKAMHYAMVLFTRNDQLDKPIEEYINENEHLKQLIRECKGGYHCFNNKDKNDRTQVTELLEKINRLFERNGRAHYTNELYQEAQRMLKVQEKIVKKLYETYMKEKEENLKEKEENLKEKEENLKDKEENMKENLKEKEENMKVKEENMKVKEENLKQKEENMKEKEENLKVKEENLKQKEENMKEKEENLKVKEENLKQKEAGKGLLAGLFDGLKFVGSQFQSFCKSRNLLVVLKEVGPVIVISFVQDNDVRQVITSLSSLHHLVLGTRPSVTGNQFNLKYLLLGALGVTCFVKILQKYLHKTSM